MSEKNDDLGERIKGYENITRSFLLPRSYTMIRVDGRAFSSYTKNLKRPFDLELNQDLDATWMYLCQNIQNAKLGYAQSDEFSLLLTDFDDVTTQQFFGGNIQKICSVVASMAAAKFNILRAMRKSKTWQNSNVLATTHEDLDWINRYQLAEFDCRVFTVPNWIEAYNTFYWRWKDCEKNSISQVASAHFSHKELQGKNGAERQEMLWAGKGINWSTFDESLKNGRLFVKEKEFMPPAFPSEKMLAQIKENAFTFQSDFTREKWVIKPCWKVSENSQMLKDLISKYE